MPTYEYECNWCGTFEVTASVKDEKLKTCPLCSEPVRILISSATPFVLKGSGWAKDNYHKTSAS